MIKLMYTELPGTDTVLRVHDTTGQAKVITDTQSVFPLHKYFKLKKIE